MSSAARSIPETAVCVCVRVCERSVPRQNSAAESHHLWTVPTDVATDEPTVAVVPETAINIGFN